MTNRSENGDDSESSQGIPSLASRVATVLVPVLDVWQGQLLVGGAGGFSSMVTRYSRDGSPNIKRGRSKVVDIFREYGPSGTRRAFRMDESVFWTLLDVLEEKMPKREERKKGATQNGEIENSVRLGIALRYFAGGDPYDIAIVFHVSRTCVFLSIWLIVEAINTSDALDISYPSDYDGQREIAEGFRKASAVDFGNCGGCIDGILIWINKPSVRELEKVGIGGRKFYCGRKKKFGLNMQATCDSRRRFLDINIRHPASASDYLAFAVSDFHHKLENGKEAITGGPFLCSGLAIYGDNAYVNTSYMAVPFRGVSSGPKDAYNFYHSQVSYQARRLHLLSFCFKKVPNYLFCTLF
jgi:hypothetical protein